MGVLVQLGDYAIDGFRERVDDHFEFIIFDDKRRPETHDVADNAGPASVDKDTSRERFEHDVVSEICVDIEGFKGVPVPHDFDRLKKSSPARLCDVGMTREFLLQEFAEDFSFFSRALDKVLSP